MLICHLIHCDMKLLKIRNDVFFHIALIATKSIRSYFLLDNWQPLCKPFCYCHRSRDIFYSDKIFSHNNHIGFLSSVCFTVIRSCVFVDIQTGRFIGANAVSMIQMNFLSVLSFSFCLCISFYIQ